MPRLPKINEPVLRDLAQELRYAPRPALLRHIERAEQLATLLEVDQVYPREWIVFRVTGFRPSGQAGDMPKGRDVLASLSAFVEGLCESASLNTDELPQGSLDPDELCRKWGISRMTLDRARRRGLVARRVVGLRGTRSLRFTPRAYEAYETRFNPGAKPTSRRMSQTERDAIVRRARRYHARLGLSLNQSARRLAPRFGYSLEGVRQLLQRECTDTFGRTGSPTQREQEFAYRALRRGIEPAQIAERLSRPRSSVVRAAHQHRLRFLKALDLTSSGEMLSKHHESEPNLLQQETREGAWRAHIPVDVMGFIDACRSARVFEREEEYSRAAAMQLLRSRARHTIAQASSQSSVLSSVLDEAETALREASQIKSALAASQLGLLLATAERRIDNSIERLPERQIRGLTDVMFATLCHAIDGFDPMHGGRLAARAGLAMDRAAAGFLRYENIGRTVEGRAHRMLVESSANAGHARMVDPWQPMLDPDPRVAREAVLASFDGAEILCLRFGLGVDRPHTLAWIADRLGLPIMHVARQERMLIRTALSVARERIR